MICHEIDYEIIGHDMQFVEIELDQHETVIAEAGAMNWMDDGISFESKMGDGSDVGKGFFSKLAGVGKRFISGESLFMTHFTNVGGGKRRVAFSAPYPGSIIPLEMHRLGHTFYCQKDAFLCAALGTRLDIAFQQKLGTGFFGGEGFILQKIQGDGRAFIHAGGTVIRKRLEGQLVRVDTGCLVGFTEGIDYDIEMVKGLSSMFFGGEGLFFATLRGHGYIYLQSLPFSRLADRVIAAAPSVGGRRQGEGSLLGGIGDMLDGDN